jgi:hypothetical protein
MQVQWLTIGEVIDGVVIEASSNERVAKKSNPALVVSSLSTLLLCPRR